VPDAELQSRKILRTFQDNLWLSRTMFVVLRLLVAVVSTLAIASSPAGAQSPPPPAAPPPAAPPSAAPEAPSKQPEEAAAPAEKPEAKKSKKGGGKKSKREKEEKEEKKSSGFDPKSFLLKLVLNADEDGDGELSTEEFRKVPLLKELKKERVDSLFADIDADTNASLNAEEIGKGFGKITSLAKESRSLLDDEDAAKQAKKLKRLAK
jgi:hypothetical protein